MKISAREIDFGYGKESILKEACLDVYAGELISIVGPNGTGKSTFIKCINRLLGIRNGEILLEQQSIKSMSQAQIAEKISYVPQSSNNIFSLSVFDMVLFGRQPHASFRTSKEDRLKVIKALSMLNIESLAMKDFNELSGGQQQKVVIARALAQETQIIVLDEPISNLDLRHQLEVMDILQNLVKEFGITVLMVMHDLNMAINYSDRIAVMDHGQVTAIGKPEEIMTKERIASVYGVEVEVLMVDRKPHIIPLRVCSGKTEVIREIEHTKNETESAYIQKAVEIK